MPNRKTLKVQPETFNKLQEQKRPGETWDGLLNRIATDKEQKLSETEIEEIARATAIHLKDEFVPEWWPW